MFPVVRPRALELTLVYHDHTQKIFQNYSETIIMSGLLVQPFSSYCATKGQADPESQGLSQNPHPERKAGWRQNVWDVPVKNLKQKCIL